MLSLISYTRQSLEVKQATLGTIHRRQRECVHLYNHIINALLARQVCNGFKIDLLALARYSIVVHMEQSFHYPV